VKRTVCACACFLAVIAMAGCGGSNDKTTAATTESTTTETTNTEKATTSETTTTTAMEPTAVSIVVVDGSPKGGIVRQTVSKGDRVVLVVTSDVADEIHLHGYDVSREVEAGGSVRLPFTATIPGRFEVELEQRGVQIADITVSQ
jgi:hypothetical protein